MVGAAGPASAPVVRARRSSRSIAGACCAHAQARARARAARPDRRTQRRARRRSRRPHRVASSATPTPASRRCSTGSPTPACSSRTGCSPPSTHAPGGSTCPAARPCCVSDTVGFVRKLPHQLVEAFRSTLEVVAESDLLVHVVDASAADPEGQIDAVPIGAGRDRRRRRARAAGVQQGRRSRREAKRLAEPPRRGSVDLGRHRRGHRRAARRRSATGCGR